MPHGFLFHWLLFHPDGSWVRSTVPASFRHGKKSDGPKLSPKGLFPASHYWTVQFSLNHIPSGNHRYGPTWDDHLHRAGTAQGDSLLRPWRTLLFVCDRHQALSHFYPNSWAVRVTVPKAFNGVDQVVCDLTCSNRSGKDRMSIPCK